MKKIWFVLVMFVMVLVLTSCLSTKYYGSGLSNKVKKETQKAREANERPWF